MSVDTVKATTDIEVLSVEVLKKPFNSVCIQLSDTIEIRNDSVVLDGATVEIGVQSVGAVHVKNKLAFKT